LVINNKIENLTQARKVLGTSSLTYEIIPLALYIFLKFATSFEEAVLAGANSFRNDSEEEKQKLAHYSYLEELVEARGGCTDGIAGLVGSFCGTYLGLSSIPEKLLQPLENREKITKLIKTTF
jgi:ADP-ribosylglycohydrolase